MRRATSNLPRMHPVPKTPLQNMFGYNSQDRQLPVTNQDVLLTDIAGQEAAARVLSEGGILDEGDIEVRPEELTSALQDHRVALPKLEEVLHRRGMAVALIIQ
ncbi:hypothetical protein MTO96_031828 [Rhipicephalus appendiculatus]